MTLARIGSTSRSKPASAAASESGSSGPNVATAVIPDGVRVVLTLPPGQAVSGRLTVDWIRPTWGGGKT